MMFRNRKMMLVHGLFLVYSLFAVGCFLVFDRGQNSGQSRSMYDFIPILMIWNVLLAFVGFDAVQLHLWSERRLVKIAAAFIGFLFYPNSYYMMTDAKHLGDWFPDPLQMDFAQMDAQKLCYFVLLMTGIFFGVFLGFESIKPVLQRYFVSWIGKSSFVLLMSLLSSVAIYAGRVSSARINSWDVFYRPFYALGKLFAVIQTGNFLFLLMFTLFQVFIIELGYAIVWRD